MTVVKDPNVLLRENAERVGTPHLAYQYYMLDTLTGDSLSVTKPCLFFGVNVLELGDATSYIKVVDSDDEGSSGEEIISDTAGAYPSLGWLCDLAAPLYMENGLYVSASRTSGNIPKSIVVYLEL